MRLKILREENNLSQFELADKLNMSQQAISAYENGKREPDIETIKKFAGFFGVSTDYLLEKSNVRNPEPQEDPLGLAKIGFSMKDYTPPTETQKEQIKSLIEVILKDNKKDETDDKK